MKDEKNPAAGPGRMSLSLPTCPSEIMDPHLEVFSPNLLPTWVTNDLSNGAAPPRLTLSSNSDAVDLSPFEYDFQGLLDVESSDVDCNDDLCALDDRAGALIGRYLNLGTWEHLIMFESVFDLVGNFCTVPVYM